MVWGAISTYGVSWFLDDNKDPRKYCTTIEKALFSIADEKCGEIANWLYQQDGATTHRSGFNRSWLSTKGVRTIQLAAKSPDFNILENVWGIMARLVYLQQRQFDPLEDLKNVIKDVWATISGELVQKFYLCVPRRMLAVLDEQGRATKY